MPVVEYRIVAGQHEATAVGQLLEASCTLFAAVLECPFDRVRAFAHEVQPSHACFGGTLVSQGAAEAPFFTFALLEGRTEEQKLRLLEGFTDLLVEHLGADRSLVRGAVWMVPPTDWAIAGVPAAVARQAEVQARARG